MLCAICFKDTKGGALCDPHGQEWFDSPESDRGTLKGAPQGALRAAFDDFVHRRRAEIRADSEKAKGVR